MSVNEEKFEINSLSNLNEYLSNQDNSENAVYTSKVPQICKDEPCMLGIDEAGRGPVLGPMVYGIAYCPLSAVKDLDKLQCEDSKALTEEKRDKIFTTICDASDVVGWAVEVISPNTICKSMNSRSKISLNQVSMDSAIGLIRKAIENGVNIAEIYVDTVGPPDKYQKYLSSLFPDYIITVAKKADSTYPIVSAASICAKVTRDHSLQIWKFQEGFGITHKEFGSGYPGDPVTKKFLVDNINPVFGFPQLVRFSWSTSQNILEKEAYTVEWEDLREEKNEATTNNTSITSFFKTFKKGENSAKKPRHKFFLERCLDSTTEF